MSVWRWADFKISDLRLIFENDVRFLDSSMFSHDCTLSDVCDAHTLTHSIDYFLGGYKCAPIRNWLNEFVDLKDITDKEFDDEP